MNLLEIHDLRKNFGGLMAVRDVSFTVENHSIVGLIGPNGAGKTTVFNLITGNYRPDAGEILFQGNSLRGAKPHSIVKKGIARTFQTIRLFQRMSVLENVLAGCHCHMHQGLFATMLRLPAWKQEEKKAQQQAMDWLRFVGLEHEWQNLACNLSYGNQRLLEIARALASRPRLLVLDEPAGGMNDQETADLTELIFRIRKQGSSVLLIEHDMNLVMRVCSSLVVLEHGEVIAAGSPQEVRADPRVVEAYLGTDDDEFSL